MRWVEQVVDEYDATKKTGQKKIILINWFKKHPGKRFDKAEVHEALHEELDVGVTRVGQYLNDLEDDSVLDSRGSQRKAYWLKSDIIVPVKFQIRAGLRHLYTTVDIKRWGIVGFLVVSTVIWGFLTLPFWFFSAYMLISPSDGIGVISDYEIFVFAIAMTLWLLVFVTLSYVLHRAQLFWQSSTTSE
ncbi:hypothetical protein G3A49_13390 [Haloferax volcanii]|uniref:Uncharacterized protein n=1 Tax=Haloferax volcanii TaxID=2246 RepID=A0A6C0UUB5_HALVO|nr:hypothetical protein [Haloferax alexandrinus]QIB79072.1 hypothetical protein G3A49_13390 [Haloferax alexandrinus]